MTPDLQSPDSTGGVDAGSPEDVRVCLVPIKGREGSAELRVLVLKVKGKEELNTPKQPVTIHVRTCTCMHVHVYSLISPLHQLLYMYNVSTQMERHYSMVIVYIYM